MRPITQILCTAVVALGLLACDDEKVADTSGSDLAQDVADTAELPDVAEDTPIEAGPDLPPLDVPNVDTGVDSAGDADSVGPDTPDTPDTGPVVLRGECALDNKGGTFTVAASDTFPFISGSMSNGVVPVTILEEVTVVGDCRLMRRNNPFCAPPCGPGTTCDFDGSCIPFPLPQDLGDVAISGLTEGTVTMTPVQPGNNYFNTQVPNPPFDAGAAILMTTGAKGAYGAKMLHGRGFEVLAANDSWSVAASADFEVTWTAPTAATEGVKVHLEMNLDQHGNSPIILTCDFDDDGSATVPASLIDELLNSGISGFPNGELRRQTVDSVPMGSLCMELVVSSGIVPSVQIDGHTPCNTTLDCPAGQICNAPINTCE